MPSISLGAKQGDRTLGLLWRGHHKTMHNSALCQKFSLVLFPQQGALLTSTCINLKESSDFLHKDGKLVTKFWDEANAANVLAKCTVQTLRFSARSNRVETNLKCLKSRRHNRRYTKDGLL